MKNIFQITLIACLITSAAQAAPTITRTNKDCTRALFTITIPFAEREDVPNIADYTGLAPSDYKLEGVYYSRNQNSCMFYIDYLSYQQYHVQSAYNECVRVASGAFGRDGLQGRCQWVNAPMPASAQAPDPNRPVYTLSNNRCYSGHRVTVLQNYVRFPTLGNKWGASLVPFAYDPTISRKPNVVEVISTPRITQNGCEINPSKPIMAGRYFYSSPRLTDERIIEENDIYIYENYLGNTPPQGLVGFKFEVRCGVPISNCR